jgi:hypothetical protein
MNYLLRALAFGFVSCFLWSALARGDSANSLALSIDSLSNCPSSGCFNWDPSASAIGFNLSSSGGTLAASLQLSARNGIGLNITEFKIFIPATGLDITCASNIFSTCAVENQLRSTVVVFSGGTIYPNQHFLFDFGCAATTPCSWPTEQEVFARTITNVPEPGTMALLLTGVAAILVRRRP